MLSCLTWFWGKIFINWASFLFGHQINTTSLIHHLADIRVWVTKISKMSCVGWACSDASWNAIFFWQVVIVNSVYAESAFLHYTCFCIHFPRSISTSPGAQPAANAGIFIDQHYSIL